MEIRELNTDVFSQKITAPTRIDDLSNPTTATETGAKKPSRSSWRKFTTEATHTNSWVEASSAPISLDDLKLNFEALKLNRENANLVLECLNRELPANLSLEDILLLPSREMEDVFGAILVRAKLNFYLGNFTEAFADEIMQWSMLMGTQQVSLEGWNFALFYLGLGEEEKGLSHLKQMAAKTGEPLSYLLLKSLGQPLPPPSPASAKFKRDPILARIEQLVQEQRFEEAIAKCDEFFVSHPQFIVGQRESLELYFNILGLRGLCKGMLNDFSGAIQDYDRLISHPSAEDFRFKEDYILERGLLQYLDGNKEKARTDFDSLIHVCNTEIPSLTSSTDEQNLQDYVAKHVFNVIPLYAVAIKKNLYL